MDRISKHKLHRIYQENKGEMFIAYNTQFALFIYLFILLYFILGEYLLIHVTVSIFLPFFLVNESDPLIFFILNQRLRFLSYSPFFLASSIFFWATIIRTFCYAIPGRGGRGGGG